MRTLFPWIVLLVATSSLRAEEIGWRFTGPSDGDPRLSLKDYGYEGGVDDARSHGGRRSAFLRAITAAPKKQAVVMQSIAADRYRGKRVRLAAFILTENAGAACLGIEVVSGATSVGRGRAPIKGTTAWQRYELVVDVPSQATQVNYGLLLEGAGEARIDDVSLEVVDASVPLTDPPRLPLEPQNLDFER
jgi:hypothetical protein